MAQESTKPKSNQVHFILQGKGGVGKSLISAILAQYFRGRKVTPHCFDTDPVNATFAQYQALVAEHINVLGDEGLVLRERGVDRVGVETVRRDLSSAEVLGEDGGNQALADAAFALQDEMDLIAFRFCAFLCHKVAPSRSAVLDWRTVRSRNQSIAFSRVVRGGSGTDLS